MSAEQRRAFLSALRDTTPSVTNRSILERAAGVSDLRTDLYLWLDYEILRIDIDGIVGIFEWLEEFGERLVEYAGLLVLRAACLDILLRYATCSPHTRTPLQAMVNPKNSNLMHPDYIRGALAALPPPQIEYGKIK